MGVDYSFDAVETLTAVCSEMNFVLVNTKCDSNDLAGEK